MKRKKPKLSDIPAEICQSCGRTTYWRPDGKRCTICVSRERSAEASKGKQAVQLETVSEPQQGKRTSSNDCEKITPRAESNLRAINRAPAIVADLYRKAMKRQGKKRLSDNVREVDKCGNSAAYTCERLERLKSNWRFSQPTAQRYIELANYSRMNNLDSATSISEALRMIAEAKQESDQ